ncbi:unnamed protein product [Diplocarpon coronariae]
MLVSPVRISAQDTSWGYSTKSDFKQLLSLLIAATSDETASIGDEDVSHGPGRSIISEETIPTNQPGNSSHATLPTK